MLSHPLTYPQPPVASLTFVLPIAQLAEAVPVPGSGLTLPLDLHAIGARCTNAYYAPKRFAAVQLAFSNPRCRVLVFHTGRLVGTGARFGPHTHTPASPPRAPFLYSCLHCTGCSGPMAARMAILKAARQLAVEAKVYVHIRKFSVINQVRVRAGAGAGGAGGGNGSPGLPGLQFQIFETHLYRSARSRSTPSSAATPLPPRTRRRRTTIARRLWALRGVPEGSPSAVVRSWPITRPASFAHGACTCAEIYSTGKANLPGSTRQRDLLGSFSRMVSELLRHSDKPEMCSLIPEQLRLCHRPQTVTRDDAPVVALSRARAPPPPRAAVGDLFSAEGNWALGPLNPVLADDFEMADDDDLLERAGF